MLTDFVSSISDTRQRNHSKSNRKAEGSSFHAETLSNATKWSILNENKQTKNLIHVLPDVIVFAIDKLDERRYEIIEFVNFL